MASRAHPEGVRHVGRIVDPLARDDGETEPMLELDEADERPSDDSGSNSEDPAPFPETTANSPALDPTTPEEREDEALIPDPNVHPVKARLMARARASAARGEGATEDSPTEAPLSAPRGFDEIGTSGMAPRAPSAPMASPGRPAFSPNMVALFGALLGLAAVASVIALATALDPKPGEVVPVEAKTEGESEASEATPAAEPTTPKPKRVKIPGPWRIKDAKGKAGMRVIEGTIGTAPFLRAIQDAGVDKKQAYRVYTALKGMRNLDRCKKSDAFAALIERSSKRIKAFEYIVSKEEIYQAKENAAQLLQGKKLDLKIERMQRSGGFTLQAGKIDDAAERAGLERGMAKALAKTLSGHLSIEELKRGDRIRVVAQEVTVLGEFARYSGVEAVELLRKGEKPLRIYYFRGSSSRGYFDSSGRSPYEGGWRKPVKGAPVTSKFNPKRMHPVLKKVMPHNGTDFGAPAGTPVGASSYGTVSFVGYAGASGNLVKIEHFNDIETGYAHLSRFAEGLKVGDKVKRLQVIGYVGSTGRSTGPHLHFTAKKNGKFFDAETLNLDGMRVLPPSERGDFAKVKQRYDKLLNAIPEPPMLEEPVATAPSQAEGEESSEPDLELPGGGSASPKSGTGGGAEEPKPTAAKPSPEPAAPSPAKPTSGGSAVYLTDKDLMKMQSATDDGEVDE